MKVPTALLLIPVAAFLLVGCQGNDRLTNEVISISEGNDRWSNLHKTWTGSCSESGLAPQEPCGRLAYRDGTGVVYVIGVALNSECFGTARIGDELPDVCPVRPAN